jgi:hypothetical protein
VSTELDLVITELGSDSGISETTSIRVLKDAIVILSVLRVDKDKEVMLKDVVGNIATPMLEDPMSNNIRFSKVEIPEYLGSLNS